MTTLHATEGHTPSPVHGEPPPLHGRRITLILKEYERVSEAYLAAMARGLARLGSLVTVFETEGRPLAARRTFEVSAGRIEIVSSKPTDYSLYRLIQTAQRMGTTHGRLDIAARDLARRTRLRELADSNPDLVVFATTGLAVEWMSVAESLAVPFVVSCRGSAENVMTITDPARAAHLLRIFELATRVHCVSESMRRRVESIGCPPERIFVNPPGVNLDVFQPKRTYRTDADTPFRLLTVSPAEWIRGLDYSLVAVSQLAQRGVDVRFTLVGQGGEMDKVRWMIEDLGLIDSVILLGQQDSDRIQGLMRESDAYLRSGLTEGLSNSVVEAMATGLPVVATDVGGSNEAVSHGRTGLLVRPYDPTLLSDALYDLASDPVRARRFGIAGRQAAEERFDVDRETRVFAAEYEALCHRRPTPLRASERAQSRISSPQLRRKRPPAILVIGSHAQHDPRARQTIEALAGTGSTVTIASADFPDTDWTGPLGVDWLPLPCGSTTSDLERLCTAVRDAERTGHLTRSQITAALTGRGSATELTGGLVRSYIANGGYTLGFVTDLRLLTEHLEILDASAPLVATCTAQSVFIEPWAADAETYRHRLNIVFGRVVAVHCASQAVADAAARLGLDPVRSRVVPPAVGLHPFPPPSPSRGGSVEVLCLGPLDWRGGVETALLASAEAIRRGARIRLTISGEGTESERIRSSIRDLQLEDHVALTGVLGPEESRERLTRSHVLLDLGAHPLASEALIEAMSAGLIIVTTDTPEANEVLSGMEFEVVPVRDIASTADVLHRLFADPDHRLRRGIEVRELTRDQYSRGRQIAGLATLVESVSLASS